MSGRGETAAAEILEAIESQWQCVEGPAGRDFFEWRRASTDMFWKARYVAWSFAGAGSLTEVLGSEAGGDVFDLETAVRWLPDAFEGWARKSQEALPETSKLVWRSRPRVWGGLVRGVPRWSLLMRLGFVPMDAGELV